MQENVYTLLQDSDFRMYIITLLLQFYDCVMRSFLRKMKVASIFFLKIQYWVRIQKCVESSFLDQEDTPVALTRVHF